MSCARCRVRWIVWCRRVWCWSQLTGLRVRFELAQFATQCTPPGPSRSTPVCASRPPRATLTRAARLSVPCSLGVPLSARAPPRPPRAYLSDLAPKLPPPTAHPRPNEIQVPPSALPSPPPPVLHAHCPPSAASLASCAPQNPPTTFLRPRRASPPFGRPRRQRPPSPRGGSLMTLPCCAHSASAPAAPPPAAARGTPPRMARGPAAPAR